MECPKNLLTFISYSTECIAGYYWSGCRDLCNGYCITDEMCNHINGICVAGCQEGYIGRNCNNCKRKNIYLYIFQLCIFLLLLKTERLNTSKKK